MPRVLHCIYDDPANPWLGGGGAIRVFEIYRRLTDRLSVTVATGNYPDAVDETIDGVRYVRLGAQSPYPWSRWTFGRQATRLLKSASYDAGIFDFSVYSPVRVPRDRSVGHVVHMPIGPTASARWGRVAGGAISLLERRMLSRARVVSTTSEWMADKLAPRVADGASISIARSGVSDEFFNVERDEAGYILFYGRFDVFQKGIDVLLQAHARLRRHRPSLMLHLAGRGAEADRIRTLIRDAGIQESVALHDAVTDDEVLDLMAGAAVLVMPSRFEGLPMVPAEAMAGGVPVVASDVGAMGEVVAPPAGGVLVPADDPAALAEEVGKLLDDPSRRSAISRSARRAARRFLWETVAEQHLDFVNRVAGDVAADAAGSPNPTAPETQGKT